MAAKHFIELFGNKYPTDSFTNLTPRLIEHATKKLYKQPNNPLYLISQRIRHFFQVREQDGYRYDEFSYDSPVVSVEDNFDSLLVPKNHVSRSKSDTYYVNSNYLFRSHTSAHQTDCLRKNSLAFISIADCFRRDQIDRSHFPAFHQCEVFRLFNHKQALGDKHSANDLYDQTSIETSSKQACYDQRASSFVEQKLKATIEEFVKEFFDKPNLQTRWVDAYFPFTHPSFELEILWRDKWMELLGCGVVRDEILRNVGLRDHIGFAAGFGLERFGMLKYDIPDIRLFWTKDTGFTHQFENKSPFDSITFKSFSNCPQCINDLSFWLDNSINYDPNDFYDLCRSIAGDLVEQVQLIDEFHHPKTGRTSHCYRVVYRAPDRVLTKDEVNVIHNQIAKTTELQYNVELRS